VTGDDSHGAGTGRGEATAATERDRPLCGSCGHNHIEWPSGPGVCPMVGCACKTWVETNAAYVSPVTHRVGLILGVHAATDDEADKIAEAFYERFAKEAQEIDGLLWLLPVAEIKRQSNVY